MTKSRLLRRIRLLAAIAFWPALAVVAWGELTPHPPPLEGPWAWDKADHFTAYFGLMLLAALFWGRRRSLTLVFLSIVALGGGLEILQAFVGRDAEWGDFLANTLGAITGLGLALLLLSLATRLVADIGAD